MERELTVIDDFPRPFRVSDEFLEFLGQYADYILGDLLTIQRKASKEEPEVMPDESSPVRESVNDSAG